MTARPPDHALLARHLAGLYGEDSEDVVKILTWVFAAADEGSVCLDLSARDAAPPEVIAADIGTDKAVWIEALALSPMVTPAGSRQVNRPLVLDGHRVYLARTWREEDEVARRLVAHAQSSALEMVASKIVAPDQMPNGEISDQRKKDAVVAAGQSLVSVLAGGPGTGKTLAVAYILDALAHHLDRPIDAILTAPTGRAATRLSAMARSLDPTLVRVTDSGTLHKVLGIRGASPEHDAESPLAADVVVVDEASMLPQSLCLHLLRALAPHTRLILVGDPDQLASVAPGDILADIVRAATDGNGAGKGMGKTRDNASIRVTRLDKNYRSNTTLQFLAQAIRGADSDGVMAALSQENPAITWLDVDVSAPDFTPEESLGPLLTEVRTLGLEMVDAAKKADAKRALQLLESHRMLAAPREGPSGVHYWTKEIRAAVLGHSSRHDRWPVGLPLLVTRNNPTLGVFNGDSGVIVNGVNGPMFACGDADNPRLITPSLVGDTEPLYASTVHKAQGSEYDTVTLIVPHEDQALLTRRLFYTAVTRAKEKLRIVGTEAAIRRAILQPDTRSTGLVSRMGNYVQFGSPDGHLGCVVVG